MAEDGLQELASELRAPPPDALRALSDSDLRDLAGAVRDARHRQAAALATAGENAFGQVPRLLRGPIRRLFS
jgi:hypothetical protein